MSLLKRAGRLLIENFWWRVLALAIAVVIWALVASEPELSTFATVPLQFRGLPDDIEMSTPPAETVTLELRGPSSELRGLTDSRSPAVVLDMTGVTPGIRSFSIDKTDVRLARGVRLVRAVPSEVEFDFDRRLERTVPVKVRFAGTGAGLVARYTVTPPSLTIVGPSRHVARISSVYTDPIDVSSISGTAELRVNAFVDDSFVRFESSPEVTVDLTLKK
jgi:YbbR domain-containing protein